MNKKIHQILDKLSLVSTTDQDNFNNPDMILVQCPGWGIKTPPLGLASLVSTVRSKGHKILPLDLNIEFNYFISSSY